MKRKRGRVDKSRDACPSRKWRFPDHDSALSAARAADAYSVELHTYACTMCKGWHLTSTPQR